MKKIFKALMKRTFGITNRKNQPNVNELWRVVKDIPAIRINIKNMGYAIAKELHPKLLSVSHIGEPKIHNLSSKPTTQSDIESSWFAYWCNQLKAAPLYHRKLWEYAFVLQALYDYQLLSPNKKGIGFGCGQEPIASYLSSLGISCTISDVSTSEMTHKGWLNSNQHTTTKELAFHPQITTRELFDKHVDHQFIDMNNIPPLRENFDFCWSICAMEHLGSIKFGLEFVENSLSALKPGGLAVHTTEFNYLSQDETIDNWSTVLFLRKHFEELAKILASKGHQLVNPSFEIGCGLLDQFIDLPPYHHGDGETRVGLLNEKEYPSHLKLSVNGFASTCYGLIIKKAE